MSERTLRRVAQMALRRIGERPSDQPAILIKGGEQFGLALSSPREDRAELVTLGMSPREVLEKVNAVFAGDSSAQVIDEQTLGRVTRALEEAGIDHFAQIVGRNVRGHADSDTLRSVDQQIGESRWQDDIVTGSSHVDLTCF